MSNVDHIPHMKNDRIKWRNKWRNTKKKILSEICMEYTLQTPEPSIKGIWDEIDIHKHIGASYVIYNK